MRKNAQWYLTHWKKLKQLIAICFFASLANVKKKSAKRGKRHLGMPLYLFANFPLISDFMLPRVCYIIMNSCRKWMKISKRVKKKKVRVREKERERERISDQLDELYLRNIDRNIRCDSWHLYHCLIWWYFVSLDQLLGSINPIATSYGVFSLYIVNVYY